MPIANAIFAVLGMLIMVVAIDNESQSGGRRLFMGLFGLLLTVVAVLYKVA